MHSWSASAAATAKRCACWNGSAARTGRMELGLEGETGPPQGCRAMQAALAGSRWLPSSFGQSLFAMKSSDAEIPTSPGQGWTPHIGY